MVNLIENVRVKLLVTEHAKVCHDLLNHIDFITNSLHLTYVAGLLRSSSNNHSPSRFKGTLCSPTLKKTLGVVNAHLLLEGLDLLRLGSPFARPISTRWTVLASPITKKRSQTINPQAKEFQKYIITCNSHL